MNLTRIQSRVNRSTDQISSGLKVAAPSDAPDQISNILQIYTDLGRNAQIQANLNRIRSEAGTAESTLGTAIQIVDRARMLAAQGVGTTQSAETRVILAREVQGLLEQLVTASQTTVSGRYIFSGDQDEAPAYELNLANPNGVNRLSTAPASRRIQHPSGTTFAAARTAQDIFDAQNPDDTLAPENVFAALNGLRLALESNNPAGIDAWLASLRARRETT